MQESIQDSFRFGAELLSKQMEESFSGASLTKTPALAQDTTAVTVMISFCAQMRALADIRPDSSGTESAVRMLVALLHSHSRSLKAEAVAALVGLTTAVKEHRITVLHAGGVDPLLQLIQAEQGDVRWQAANVLGLIASVGPDAADKLASHEPVSILVKMIEEGSESEAAYWASVSLQHLSERGEANCKKIANQPGAIASIVALVCSSKKRYTEASGATLKALLQSTIQGDFEDRKRRTQQFSAAIKEQQSGQSAAPPVAFPDLMELLQNVSLEQIQAAQEGSDTQLLEDAIAFGRWVKVPASNFGKARNRFKEIAAEQEKQNAVKARREALGLEKSKTLAAHEKAKAPAADSFKKAKAATTHEKPKAATTHEKPKGTATNNKKHKHSESSMNDSHGTASAISPQEEAPITFMGRVRRASMSFFSPDAFLPPKEEVAPPPKEEEAGFVRKARRASASFIHGLFGPGSLAPEGRASSPTPTTQVV
jgi:hypothetical protein